MNDKYEQDQRVYFRMGEKKPEGWAKVKGVQGFVIILEPEEPLTGYDYTTIYVVDSQIGNPPEEATKETFYGDGEIGKQ